MIPLPPDPKEKAPKDPGAGAEAVELAENEKAEVDDEVGFSIFAADDEELKLKREAALVATGATPEEFPNENGLAGSLIVLVGFSFSLLTTIVFSRPPASKRLWCHSAVGYGVRAALHLLGKP